MASASLPIEIKEETIKCILLKNPQLMEPFLSAIFKFNFNLKIRDLVQKRPTPNKNDLGNSDFYGIADLVALPGCEEKPREIHILVEMQGQLTIPDLARFHYYWKMEFTKQFDPDKGFESMEMPFQVILSFRGNPEEKFTINNRTVYLELSGKTLSRLEKKSPTLHKYVKALLHPQKFIEREHDPSEEPIIEMAKEILREKKL